MPHVGAAFAAFESRGIFDVLREAKPQSMLYVGWRSDTSPWWKNVLAAGLQIPDERITILEVYPPNYGAAVRALPSCQFILGDIRECEKLLEPGKYDLIFWDHGPEHIPTADLTAVTPKLFELSGKVLLYSCPWGPWPQGPEGGNTAETHYDVSDNQLRDLGMTVVTVGQPGQEKLGEIVAWRVK